MNRRSLLLLTAALCHMASCSPSEEPALTIPATVLLPALVTGKPKPPAEKESPGLSPDEIAKRRDLIRRQFEAAERGEQLHVGSSAHLAFDCPHCVDPMKGLVPEDALLDGPAVLWN